MACAGLCVGAAPASAEVTSVLGGIACDVAEDGVRECGGTDSFAKTFDGVPIDVNVALPPEPASGPDGPYPLVMQFHGYGGQKLDFDELRRWTEQGYAAFSMSDRGFGRSCGDPEQRVPGIGGPDALTCLGKGYVRLMDTRYEVRDAQLFAGRLVDEDVVDSTKIAATGGSYGGGLSMALAALKNRVMQRDDTLVPWTSPDGTPISLAAAAPEIPWTDLAYSLVPNGRTLDYVTDAPYQGRVGVPKQTFIAGLFALGNAAGYYAAPGMDPDADLTTWFTRINTGDPADDDPLVADIIDEITTHHSSYYIDDSTAPAPLLISNGWTDDLFPADEAIRFYNRTRANHPGSDISLFFLDYGHQRGQNKDADIDMLQDAENEFFAQYLDEGPKYSQGIRTLTQTCPGDAPSEGPSTAPSWAKISPGEVVLESAEAQQIAPTVATDAERGRVYDPVTGGGACATAPGSDQEGAASYRLDAAPAGGYTLTGSPTVIADFTLSSPTSQVAARLLDVAPNGEATLVARGLWRPEAGGPARDVFQLHPNGWRFAEGHVPKLELLPADNPYGRVSNGQGAVTVENLELRVPVLEEPGSLGGLVGEPAAKVVPDGFELAPGYGGDPEPPKRVRCRGEVATIVGTSGSDTLNGTKGPDVIKGRGGDDEIVGRAKDDVICGGVGRDTIFGKGGDDVIRTGPGRDFVRPGSGNDTVDGKPG